MIHYEYQFPPLVHFAGDNTTTHTFCSSTGVKQGHGFGSLVYAIGKHSVYKAMAAAEPDVRVISYLDNCYLASSNVAALQQVLRIWIDGTKKQDGVPNLHKCCVYYNEDSLSIPAQELAGDLDMTCVDPQQGFDACGIPLGAADYVQAQLQIKIDRNDRLFDHLREMDPQCANLLLRNAGLPRMGFLLRGVPADHLQPWANQFDDSVLRLFREIAHLPNDEQTVSMIQVHLRHGGFGLPRQAPLAPGANLASLLLALPILSAFFPGVKDLLADYKREKDSGVIPANPADVWRTKAHDAGLNFIGALVDAWELLGHLELPPDSLPSHPMELLCGFFVEKAKELANPQNFRIQRYLSHQVAEQAHQKLLDGVKPFPAVAARILSNQHGGATAWLRVVPSHQSLRLSGQDFRITAQLHAGLRPTVLPNVPCVCGKELSVPHALSCVRSKVRFWRHDALVDDTHVWLRRRRIHASKEVHVSDTGEDRIDIWVRADSRVRWIDFSVYRSRLQVHSRQSGKGGWCCGEKD